MDIDKRVTLLMSAQRALLGAISCPVLAIYLDYSDERLLMTVFTEASFSEDYKEALDIALTEIYADYPHSATVDIHFIEDAISPFNAEGWLVFLRYGYTAATG